MAVLSRSRGRAVSFFSGKARRFGCDDREVFGLRLLPPVSSQELGISVLWVPWILLQSEDRPWELKD